MVLHARCRGTSYTISLKSHSIAVGDTDDRVASWDRGGRLYCLVRGDVTVRRGLSGVAIETCTSSAGRTRRRLPDHEADAALDDAALLAERVSGEMATPDWQWISPVDPMTAQEARMLLDLCGRFSSGAARADASRFASVYAPVGILPPDQYLSLVVQATEGCSFNTCTFCDLYHEPYRVKTPAQFAQHVHAVRGYLGASADLRSRGIFLGAANALAVPMATLVPVFETMLEELDSLRLGVCAFVDGFTGTRKSVRDWEVLGELGLRRVYVGLESGHDPLLSFVRKPATAAQAIETVRDVKAAGLQVGVIVMTGLGGTRFAAGHVTDTAATVSAMGLGPGDLLYFSELVEEPGTAYPRLAVADAVVPLSHAECQAQRAAIRASVDFPGLPPAMATYDVRQFVY